MGVEEYSQVHALAVPSYTSRSSAYISATSSLMGSQSIEDGVVEHGDNVVEEELVHGHYIAMLQFLKWKMSSISSPSELMFGWYTCGRMAQCIRDRHRKSIETRNREAGMETCVLLLPWF
jgi:hypothetical protein